MTTTKPLKGLYVITDRQLIQSRAESLENLVEQAILGGTRLIQYRNKQSPLTVRKHEAKNLAALCREHQVTFLVNDDVDIAMESDADGLHIGQDDIPVAEARQHLGSEKIIGVTCHNDLQLARIAQQQGADYIAFGRFYPSHSKPTATPASMNTLQQASQELDIPICAIGGINQINAKSLIEHGADMLAVIHAVLGAEDVRQAAANLSRLFKE